MASKLVWDGKSRKGDAVIEDESPYINDLHLTTVELELYGSTLIEIERNGTILMIDKSDAEQLVKYLVTMIPTMKD